MNTFDPAKRFWSHVDMRESDECWEWTRARTHGYGIITINYKNILAHRLAWKLNNGREIPPGVQVRHTCGNRACCNPTHLYLATGTRRFWDNVKRRGPDQCWEWTGARQTQGYGALRVRGEYKLVHRMAWELHHGKSVPDGIEVCHSCDNPPCCNPAHLFLGSHADNISDAAMKGRMGRSIKLAAADVREIRRLDEQSRLSRREIGERFGVSRQTVNDIVWRKTWKHID